MWSGYGRVPITGKKRGWRKLAGKSAYRKLTTNEHTMVRVRSQDKAALTNHARETGSAAIKMTELNRWVQLSASGLGLASARVWAGW